VSPDRDVVFQSSTTIHESTLRHVPVPQQDCCGNLICGILFKMAVISSSVLSAHFLHTHSPTRNQTGQQRELSVVSRKLVTPSAANILHSIAAEGCYMT
jgi:hypothetical protein